MFHEIIQSISNVPISAILTISMFALLLLSVLFGILRGLKKSIFYIIFYIIGIVVFFISLGGMTNALLNFNLSGMNIRINGVLIETLNNSVPEVLRSFLSKSNDADLSGMFVKGTESYILVTSLLGFVAQLILTIGFIVVFQVAYKLIIWLLWLIFGKRSSRMKRVSVKGKVITPNKNRLLGGVMGLIPGIISIFMLFVPISGIFSVASSLTSGENQDGVSFGNYLSEEDYKALQKALGSYEESAPGKVFNIIVSQDGTSLDVMIFDKVTSVKVDDETINIRKDLESIGHFASEMISTGLLDVILSDNFTSNDLINIVKDNSNQIKEAFGRLGDAQLIDLMMNTGVEYLDSSKLVDEKLELSTDSINYKNLKQLDWSNEFEQIGSILNSTIEVLDVLPEEEKNKPMSELSSFNASIVEELDSDKTKDVLDNFVEELFKSNLVNEASTAGLEYVLGRDQVKKIVGEVDREALKDVDIKDDLLKIISALKSVIVISINNFTSVNLQELSNQSIELKNIIDELLELGIFKVVEEHVIDYTITNYVEKDANISKFVDIEELRKLGRAELKVELGALVETFGKLGEQTDLFNLEEVEDKNAKLNYNAIDSKCLRIINENIEESNLIYKFLNQALEAAFVPTIYENSEEYHDSVSKFDGESDEETRSNWVYEINVFANLLESVEKEMAKVNEKFSLLEMATNSNGKIKLGVLRGLATKDPINSTEYNDEYYLDESIFVRDIMMNTVANSASNNTLFDGLFDDQNLEYGRELDTLIKIMEEGNILESSRNDYLIEFATLEEKFYRINDVKLNAYSNHIGDSILLQRIIRKNLNGQINNNLYNEMEDWSRDRWNGEFRALSNILIDGGIVGHTELSFDEMFDSFEEISYPQIKAIKDNISPSDPANDVAYNEISKSNDKSLIVRDIMINILTIETDGSGKYVTNPETNEFVVMNGKEKLNNDLLTLGDSGWRNEIGTLAEIVKSETYIDDNGVYSRMSIDELTNINCIRPETLDVIAENIDKTILIKDAIINPIRDLLVEEENDESIDTDDVLYSDPNLWTNEEWKKELKSLAYVAYPLASSNAEKEANGYPNNRTYLDFNDLTIEGKIKLQVLENLMGESLENNATLLNSLRKFFRINTLKSKELNNNYGINHSTVLQKIFRDAMNDSINKPESDNDLYVVDFDSFTNDQYYYEVESIYNVILDANLYEVDIKTNEEYVVFENISNALKNISKSEFSAISSSISNSKLLQKQVQKALKDNFGEDFVMEMNEWDNELWKAEMNSLNEVVQTLDENSQTGAINFEIGGNVKVVTIESVRNNHYSKIVREAMKGTIDELLIIEPMNSNGVAQPLSDYQYISPIKSEDFNDFQWKYELNTLYVLSSHIAAGEGDDAYIDTENLTESLKNMKITLFEVVADLIYGENTLNGITVKSNSYILQAQLSPSIETLMNAGERITDDRIRLLHPESYVNINEGPNWNETANVPSYENSDTTNPIDDNYIDPNSTVGEWWSKELNAIYNVALEKFGPEGSFDIDGIDFGNTKISTLNSISDNIDQSYILQSCMRDTIDGVMNQEYDGGSEKYSKYDYLTSEYWDGSTWQIEIRAIRDVAKSLSKINGETPEVETTFKERNEYIPSNWIVDESLDDQYTFGLFGMSIEDRNSISLDTLYYTSIHAEDSLIVRSLLRPHIIDILNVDNIAIYDDDFMTEWTNDSNVENYKSRWDYEIAALFNVSGRMANSNGTLSLNANMFEVVPQDVIYTINGNFDDTTGNVVVDTNNHGYVANDENNDYKSNIITSLLTTSLTTEKVNPRLWDNDEWRYEINALSSVSKYLTVDGKINLSSNPVENGINIHLLDCLSNVINQSTFMQEKIESSLFAIDENLDAEKVEELTNAFPKFGFSIEKNQWNGEIKALYNVLEGTSYIAGGDTPSNLEDDLFDYNNINFSINNPIKVDIFKNISNNINQSTYLQYKLESTIEGLVPSKYKNTGEENPYYVLDRDEYFDFDFEGVYNGVTCTHQYDLPDCDHECSLCGYKKDYHLERTIDNLGNKTYNFNLKIVYDDENYHAWSVELMTIFGIMLDPSIDLVDDKNTEDDADDEIILDNIVDNLHTLSVGILTLTSNMLDKYGHDEYHCSNVVRLNLIRPLEELAYNTNASEDEVAAYDAKALIDHKKGFYWINEPLNNYETHEFNWSASGNTGTYTITSVDSKGIDHLHRYDGERSFTYDSNGSVNVNFKGWNTVSNEGANYVYNLNETLTLLNETSTTKTYIQYGLDRDGNEQELYKMDINSDGTGYWYCINKYSDLHELETFFKLIGAKNLQEAKDKLTLNSTNTMLDILNLLRERDILDEVKCLANESYLIGNVFSNRGINLQLFN